jgi:hypothetical protein
MLDKWLGCCCTYRHFFYDRALESGRSQVRNQLAWKLHLRFKASRVAGSLVPLVANLQVCLFHYRRSRAQHVSPGQPLSAIFDPAFAAAAVAYQGCQIFSGYNLPKGVKNTQWPQNYRMGKKWQYNNPNNLKSYQHFPFQGPPKCIQNVSDIWFANMYTIWQPCSVRGLCRFPENFVAENWNWVVGTFIKVIGGLSASCWQPSEQTTEWKNGMKR